MVKKLRDLTEEEYKSWKSKNCNLGSICKDCLFNNVKCGAFENECWVKHKNLYSNYFLNQKIEIESPSILNDEEKFYLNATIREVENEVYYIKKISSINHPTEFLVILYNNIKFHNIKNSYIEIIVTPEFEKGTIFKGMKLNKKYTLEELGL